MSHPYKKEASDGRAVALERYGSGGVTVYPKPIGPVLDPDQNLKPKPTPAQAKENLTRYIFGIKK